MSRELIEQYMFASTEAEELAAIKALQQSGHWMVTCDAL